RVDRISAGTSSDYPDISSDGSTICFHSTGNLTGSNPDLNAEIFVWQSGTLRQVTSTTEGDSAFVRISGNGTWVYFYSTGPLLEQNATGAEQAYRVNVATGAIQRVDGLGFATSYDSPAASSNDYNFLTPDDTGARAAWSFSTNATRANPDYVAE